MSFGIEEVSLQSRPETDEFVLVLALVVVPEAAIDVVVGQVGVAIASTRLLDFLQLNQGSGSITRVEHSPRDPIQSA